jgi:hypothetical protein
MKKALAIGALAITGLFFFGKRKAISVSQTLKSITIKVNGIKNIKLSGTSINFDTDLNLMNPTAQNLTIETAGAITLSKLIFKDLNGNPIGESYPNITDINIPAGETLRLSKIPTSIPIGIIGSAINAIMSSLSNPGAILVSAEIDTPAGTFLI